MDNHATKLNEESIHVLGDPSTFDGIHLRFDYLRGQVRSIHSSGNPVWGILFRESTQLNDKHPCFVKSTLCREAHSEMIGIHARGQMKSIHALGIRARLGEWQPNEKHPRFRERARSAMYPRLLKSTHAALHLLAK